MSKPTSPTPLAAAAATFDELTDEQRAAALRLIDRMIAVIDAAARRDAQPLPRGGAFGPAPDLPPMPDDWRAAR